MGFLFTGNLSINNYIKKFLFETLLHFVYLNKNIFTIAQNKDDLNLLKKKYNLKQNIKLIKGGSGVDIKSYLL